MEALKTHPEEPTIRYNLACYECQLGDLTVAKQHLNAATKTDTKFRGMALADPDLEPLREEIGRLEGWPNKRRLQREQDRQRSILPFLSLAEKRKK